ncbi:PepSY domain-containing protein [Bizionia paragorgiae]|uniref:Sulfite reductase (NADPH) flavoprotein alpha-component n=1 Tax=Bizionia paragorgiae TaxID=283786 RepID=A0A1H3YZC0_BIZPA|nr:PepSY domain-containing protein [Bizionia paragorgiae]SEA16501.1 sulfite reductase (NADPH) flavoprotein alpha-component [Bizionia paragorgiae]
MTISIWRYSHLALAVSSFVFVFLASVTGIVLAFQPISEQLQPFKSDGFDTASLAETLSVFKKTYPEVTALEIDKNDFVSASVITEDNKNLNGYFNPITAEYLGEKVEPSKLFQFATTLHRSLFLKGVGRFFVGLCSFLLFLIAVSGAILIIKRQRSFKKFFSKIVNDNFAQYWHVVLGRLSLIPIIVITITGVYLSLLKFNLLPESKASHTVDFEAISETPIQEIEAFTVFKNIPLADVKSVEFPFSSDVEDYYTIYLKDKEIVVNQFTGEVLSEIKYPLVTLISALSLNLHTGKGSIIWSLILAFACLNILFFIYSGFAMTLKRQKAKLRNKFKKHKCEYIILVGSENGSTIPFANAFYKQLIKAGKKVYITELNKYETFKKVKHIIVFTATYGEGEPPTNANTFLEQLKSTEQLYPISFSVVGFGSYAYPDFCQFALDVDRGFKAKKAHQFLPPFKINDRSLEAFNQWIYSFNKASGLVLEIPQKKLVSPPKQTKALQVISKTDVVSNPDDTFIITLKPSRKQRFNSGDLLAVYPENDYRERLYSIGKVNGNVQLSVKHYRNGFGSNYINSLQENAVFKARIIRNSAFHFPSKTTRVLLVANGTGIAPFIGMTHENTSKIETHLYYGLREKQSLNVYKKDLDSALQKKQLTQLHLAFSRVENKQYVQDLLLEDAPFVAETLKNNGVVMLCGSLAMQKGVLQVLNVICEKYNQKPLRYYQSKKQLKMDCY